MISLPPTVEAHDHAAFMRAELEKMEPGQGRGLASKAKASAPSVIGTGSSLPPAAAVSTEDGKGTIGGNSSSNTAPREAEPAAAAGNESRKRRRVAAPSLLADANAAAGLGLGLDPNQDAPQERPSASKPAAISHEGGASLAPSSLSASSSSSAQAEAPNADADANAEEAVAVAVAVAPVKPFTTLKCVTWNVACDTVEACVSRARPPSFGGMMSGRQTMAQVAGIIREKNPDVLALQETPQGPLINLWSP